MRNKQGNLILRNIHKYFYKKGDIAADPQIYDIKKWAGVLKGIPGFVLGSGPSLKHENLDLLNGFFTIGCSAACLSYKSIIIMWQAVVVWNRYHDKIVKSGSIKVCRLGADPENICIKFVDKEFQAGASTIPWILYGYHNGGVMAIQFAYALGCNPIVLLGMDCKCDMANIKSDQEENDCINQLLGVKNEYANIINCSDNNVWPRKRLEDVINKFKDFKYGEEYYRNMLRRDKYK